MAEMSLRGMPLFNGDSEIDQIFKIFRVLGTPDDHAWPGVSELPDYKPTFPQWGPQPLASAIPRLEEDGYDVLQQSLVYDPAKRISAKRMKRHPWFDSYRETLPKREVQKERAVLAKMGQINEVVPRW